MDKNRIIALIVFGSLVGGVILYGIISAALSIANEPNFEKKAEPIQIGDKTFYYNQYHIDTFPGDREFFFEILDSDKKSILTVSNLLESVDMQDIDYKVIKIFENESKIVYDIKFTIFRNKNTDNFIPLEKSNYLKHIIIYENSEYKFIEKDSLPEEYSFLKEYINHYHRPAGE